MHKAFMAKIREEMCQAGGCPPRKQFLMAQHDSVARVPGAPCEPLAHVCVKPVRNASKSSMPERGFQAPAGRLGNIHQSRGLKAFSINTGY